MIFSFLSASFIISTISTKQGVTNIDILLSSLGVGLNLISKFLISAKAIKEDKSFVWFLNQAVFFSTIFGVSFRKQNLTGKNFEGIDLNHTNFRESKIYHTNFRDAKNLKFACFQGTILANIKVRKLLTVSNGDDITDKDFSHLNLSGASLTNLNLTGINFTGANLTDVDFNKSNLIGANFTNAILLNANLSNTCLTEACICDWTINNTTCFKNADCSWVYLKNGKFGSLEKKPDIGEFQVGEFEKWIKQLQDTIDLILREQPNIRSLVRAIERVANNADGLDPSQFSIESKGGNLYIAKIGTTSTANKVELARTIVVNYNSINKLMMQGDSNRLFLNSEGVYMEDKSQNTNASGSIDMSSGNKINITGDVMGSSITVGELNGQVSNAIQSMRNAKQEDIQNLTDILRSLQFAINNDQILSESQKLQAMEAIATLAEEVQKPKEQRLSKIFSIAVNALKGIASTISDTSKLVDALKTHLPTLIKLLGL